MSILNVNQIQPVGGGNTITVTASDVSASGATITASSFVGNVTSSSTSTFSSGVNVTGGSVGIGTDNPARKVEIFDTSATVLQLNSTNSGGTSLRIQNSGTDKMYMGLAGDFIVGQANNVTDSAVRASGALLFASGGGTERLRITSGGSIGIATNNPAQKLHIWGNSAITALSVGDNGLVEPYVLLQANATDNVSTLHSRGNHSLTFEIQQSEKLRITSAGKVGIGTDDPDVILDVRETKTAGSTQVRVYNTDNSNATTQTAEVSLTPDSRALAGAGIKVFKENADFSTNAGRDISLALNVIRNNSQTEAVRITSSGYVGIGTDNPQDDARFQNFQSLTRYQSLQSQNGDLAIISDNNTANVAYIKGTGNAPLLKIDEGSSELFSIRPSLGPTSNQGYRVGVTTAWKIRGNNSNSELSFEYDTSATLNDNYIRVAFTDNTGPWAEGNKGITKGTIHLRSKTDDHMGGAITFGASDSGSSNSAMSGIYTRSDGSYGSKMYFATTDSYATGPKNAMTIDQYGIVTTEKQPSFLAYNITTRAQGTNLVFASTYHNTGSHYNTANGIFTAPVDGHYMFSFALLHNNVATSYARVLFSYNGNATTQYADTLMTEPGSYTATSATVVFKMSANDTMKLYNEGNAVYGYQYGSFSGHLLG